MSTSLFRLRTLTHVGVVLGACGAVAVAVWLIPATIQIVRWPAPGPSRVALLAPQYRLVWLVVVACAAACAMLVVAFRRGRLAELAHALAPLHLLWLWAVPYLPWLADRLPVLLAWSGAFRWVIAAAALAWTAAATSAATPYIQRLSMRTRRFVSGRRAVFALSFAIYLLFGTLASRTVGPGGDEPHYLIIAHSLLTDGDLRIENNHREGDYRAFWGGDLRPHYLTRGQDGEIYSIHAPGLPALLLPAYAAAGYAGGVVFVSLLAALAAMAIFDLAGALVGGRGVWVTWAAVCLSVPFVPHAWLLFPEMPGTLLVAWAALWLWRPILEAPLTWSLRGFALGLLPWLHTKFVIFLAVFAVALLLRLRRHAALAVAFAAPIALMAAAWLYSFYAIYGVPDPQVPYGDAARLEMAFGNIPRGVLGLLFDQKFGLLFHSPLYLAAAAGCWMMLRRPDTRFLGATLLAASGAFVLSSTRYYMWWGGSSAPARFLVPVLPCLAPMIAMAVHGARGIVVRALVGVWLAIGLGVALGSVAVPARLLLFPDPHGRSRLVDALQGGAPLAATLPTFTTFDWIAPVQTLLPWLAAGGVALAMMALAGRWLGPGAAPRVALVGVLTFMVAGGAIAGGPAAMVREEAARQGATALLSSYDGERHRPFDYGALRKATHAEFLDLASVELRQLPAPPISLPPGAYEARAWFGGSLARMGELTVSASPRAMLARTSGLLSNPAVVPFVLPVSVGRVTLAVGDEAAAASVVRLELVPRAIVPRSRRPAVPVRALESIGGATGGMLVYTDQSAYPEGGVFWTRDTEAATVLVAPAGASRLALTLHLGPLAGDVRVVVAGAEHIVAVPAGGVAVLETDVAPGAGLVPVIVQSPTTFRPAEVDPASDDQRRLGCQVRVELR
jgi:hypothetical protein